MKLINATAIFLVLALRSNFPPNASAHTTLSVAKIVL